MDITSVWDLYLLELCSFFTEHRDRLLELIKEAAEEACKPWKVEPEPYVEIAGHFLEERLHSYGIEYANRRGHAERLKVTMRTLASMEEQTSWYDCTDEKQAIDARIGELERTPPDDLAQTLMVEFGAFPNRSILGQYDQKPEKNHMPDYILAKAMQKLIEEHHSA